MKPIIREGSLEDLKLAYWNKFYHALHDAGATPELIKKIVDSPDNAAAIQLVTFFAQELGVSLPDRRFGEFIKVCNFKIAIDRDPQILDAYAKCRHSGKLQYYHDALTEENFANVSHRLEKGKLYQLELLPVLGSTMPEEALEHLKAKKRKILLVGAQGLAWLELMEGKKLRQYKQIASLDEKERLCQENGQRYSYPTMEFDLDGDIGFGVGNFQDPIKAGYYIICITECR